MVSFFLSKYSCLLIPCIYVVDHPSLVSGPILSVFGECSGLPGNTTLLPESALPLYDF